MGQKSYGGVNIEKTNPQDVKGFRIHLNPENAKKFLEALQNALAANENERNIELFINTREKRLVTFL